MLKIKKSLLNATLATFCTASVAILAFFSLCSFAQNQPATEPQPPQDQAADQETIGQTIGRGIDDIVSSFKQFSDDLDQNIGSISQELKKNWGDIKQGLLEAQNELQAALQKQDEGYTPEDPNEAGRSSDPYGYIKTLQNTKLPEFDATRTLGEVVNTYPHCAPRTKLWEYFTTTTDHDQFVTFSCQLPNASGQILALKDRTSLQIRSTFNDLGNSIKDFFSGSENSTLSTDQLKEAKEQSLLVSSMELISLFKIEKDQQQIINVPQKLSFYVHFADGTVGEIPLAWQQFSLLYGTQDFLEPQLSSNKQALDFIDKLTNAYLGRNQ